MKTNALEVFEALRTAVPLIVFDHGRAGNFFFARIFDQHPEVLVIPHVGYFPFHLTRVFGDRQKISGSDAVEFLMKNTDFRYVAMDMSEDVATEHRRLGDDPGFPINRRLVREVLGQLLENGTYVTKGHVVAAMHAAYAMGMGRDVSRVKYVLMNDQPLHYQTHLDVSIEEAHEKIPNDLCGSVFIHLVKDPRANFASLRHQAVRENNGMYPFFLRGILSACRSVLYGSGAWCVFILIPEYTTRGSRELFEWRMRSKMDFLLVRNEDVNLCFVPTMKRVAERLGIQWFDEWSNPNYVPTSGGLPYKGASAYNNTYQQLREEKIKRNFGTGGTHTVHGYRFRTDSGLSNESAEISASIVAPNRHVTERWKTRLTRHEIAFLEAIYYDELNDLGYETMYVSGTIISKLKGLLNVFYPLSGELLSGSWILSRLRHGGIMGFVFVVFELFLLSIYYGCSRLALLRLYLSGNLSPR